MTELDETPLRPIDYPWPVIQERRLARNRASSAARQNDRVMQAIESAEYDCQVILQNHMEQGDFVSQNQISRMIVRVAQQLSLHQAQVWLV